MKNIKGNLFDQQADAICITTNGFVKANGECVMGRGCAQEAVKRWPGIDKTLGTLIHLSGNIVQIIGINIKYKIVAFPVKPTTARFNGNNAVRHMASKFTIGELIPGWAAKAMPSIIENSAQELLTLANECNWQRIVLPRPGCGAGELKWSEIEPMLQNILDDRFEAITF
jgi:hypothetical protein